MQPMLDRMVSLLTYRKCSKRWSLLLFFLRTYTFGGLTLGMCSVVKANNKKRGWQASKVIESLVWCSTCLVPANYSMHWGAQLEMEVSVWRKLMTNLFTHPGEGDLCQISDIYMSRYIFQKLQFHLELSVKSNRGIFLTPKTSEFNNRYINLRLLTDNKMLLSHFLSTVAIF